MLTDTDRAAVRASLRERERIWRAQLDDMPCDMVLAWLGVERITIHLHTLGILVSRWERGPLAPLPACYPRLADEDDT